jgi:Flp pilus assembly protein protease CpaA
MRWSAALDNATAITLARESGLFVLLIVATFTDIAYGRIYNWLVYPAIVLGVALAVAGQIVGAGEPDVVQSLLEPDVVQSLLGLTLAAGLFGFFFARGWMGAADVKFAAAIGALKGIGFFVQALIFITLAGFMLAVIVLIWRGRFIESIKNCLVFFFRPRKLAKQMEADGRTPDMIPYGVAIAFGTMCVWILEHWYKITGN